MQQPATSGPDAAGGDRVTERSLGPGGGRRVATSCRCMLLLPAACRVRAGTQTIRQRRQRRAAGACWRASACPLSCMHAGPRPELCRRGSYAGSQRRGTQSRVGSSDFASTVLPCRWPPRHAPVTAKDFRHPSTAHAFSRSQARLLTFYVHHAAEHACQPRRRIRRCPSAGAGCLAGRLR